MTVNDHVKTQGGRQGVIVNMEVGKIMTVRFPDDTIGVFHEDLLKPGGGPGANAPSSRKSPPPKVMEDK